MRLCERNDVVVTWALVVREASTFFDAPQSPGEGQVFFRQPHFATAHSGEFAGRICQIAHNLAY